LEIYTKKYIFVTIYWHNRKCEA